ncbi:MAG: four helix bundle protein [bacterium]|nr:four helix bundle protein [bacterium]
MNIQDMEVFKKSHQITLDIYEITKKFPKEESFSLVKQMRKAAYSIPTNLSEGSVKSSDKDREHFFEISLGSCSELIYELLLSHDLGYIDKQTYDKLDETALEIKKMLYGLKKSLHKAE